MMEFIQRVSVVDEFERPDAAECLRILMKVLFDIPVDDAGRVNYLTEKVMEVVDDLSTPADELALLVYRRAGAVAKHGTGDDGLERLHGGGLHKLFDLGHCA